MAGFVVQMKGVAHDAPHETTFVQKLRQAPEVGVQDGIAPGHVEIGLSIELFAKSLGLIDDFLHLAPRHARESSAVAVGENVAMFAALVAFVGDVPLKCKCGLGGHG